jgi:hypothetical protein
MPLGKVDKETQGNALSQTRMLASTDGGTTWVSVKGTAEGELVVNNDPPATNVEGGGKISVGTTAVEITFTGTTKSVIISADKDNTGVLYVGKSDVTSAGANALVFLVAGESVSIDYEDTSNALYVVASAASQYFFKGALI